MKKVVVISIFALVFVLAFSGISKAVVLTFEDLYTSSLQAIPYGYVGFRN